MELIHIANATFSSLRKNHHLSLENLASKQKLSGLIKSRRCARRHRRRPHEQSRDHASTRWNFTQVSVPMSSRHHAPLVSRAVELVEPAGIEPATSCLQSRRSPS